MQTVSLTEAQKHLAELVHGLSLQGEWVITEADRPVARLVPVTPRPSLRDLTPRSVGSVLQPFPSPEDDRLGDMLDARP